MMGQNYGEQSIAPQLVAYVVQNHVKIAHVWPWYGVYLNLDEEMIARAPIGQLMDEPQV